MGKQYELRADTRRDVPLGCAAARSRVDSKDQSVFAHEVWLKDGEVVGIMVCKDQELCIDITPRNPPMIQPRVLNSDNGRGSRVEKPLTNLIFHAKHQPMLHRAQTSH